MAWFFLFLFVLQNSDSNSLSLHEDFLCYQECLMLQVSILWPTEIYLYEILSNMTVSLQNYAQVIAHFAKSWKS